MADELNLVMHVLMDLMERVKHLERGIVKTPRPMVNDELPLPQTAWRSQLPVGSIKRNGVTREEQEQMIELFRANMPIMEIGRRLNRSHETVYKQLRGADALPPKKKHRRPHVKKEDTEDTAYV